MTGPGRSSLVLRAVLEDALWWFWCLIVSAGIEGGQQ